MTNYSAESAVAGANQQKLIIEVSTSPDVNNIAWNTYSVTLTITYKTYQSLYSGDNQTLNRTGTWTGSTNYYMPATANTTVTIATETRTVSTQEGSPTTVNVGGTITGHYGGASFSTNISITINARPYPASKPTLSSSNFNMDTTITINTNRLNTSFTHTVRYAFGSASGTIATGVGDSTTWNSPLATLGPQVPSAVQGTGTIFVDTFNGGTNVGTEAISFTAKVPTSVVPTIGTTSVSESVTTVSTIVGTYVKLLSKLKVQLTGCAGASGSSITKHEITVNNITYDVTNLASAGASSILYTIAEALTVSGTVGVVGKVTDSRGRASTKTTNISVLNYNYPNPTDFTVLRCDSAGTLNTLGTYVKVTSKGATSSLVNGTEKNNLQYKIEYRVAGSTGAFTVLKNTTAISGLSLNVVETLGTGQFSATISHEFKLTIYDKFNNVAITTNVGTSEVTLSLNKKGIGVGKVWQKGSVDAAGTIYAGNGFYPTVDIIPASTNLNTYTTVGTYVQNADADASSGSNYPEPLAGYLEVITQNTIAGWVLQRYTVYNTERVYTRRLYNNVWSSWSGLNSPQPYGKIVKTNGFQTLAAGGTAVVMVLDFANFGVTFDSANGGGLKVPSNGVYQLSAKGYFTGSAAWLGTLIMVRWRAGVAFDLTSSTQTKPDGNDYTTSETTLESLNANDIITIKMASANGAGSTWGDANKRGTHLSLTKIA